MKPIVPTIFLTLSILHFMTVPASSAEEYSLFLPAPVEIDKITPPASGILVKKITIKRGDNLTTLSRKYSGKGGYYPQILLFNKIRNPNLIYTGRPLLVPVSFDREVKKIKSFQTQQGPSAEELLYANSRNLFDSGEYRAALAGFTRFLSDYPHSSLAADAALYRADCLLRLSGK